MTEISDTARKLAALALSVCRHYLPNGRRVGNYWVVGNVQNAPGRSMFVRLFPDRAGHKAGRWTDAATGEYGDLLDIIRHATASTALADAVVEAQAFLGNIPTIRPTRFREKGNARTDRTRQANTLLTQSSSLAGSLGETYLVNRLIEPAVADGLRFHPDCYCPQTDLALQDRWPCLIVPLIDGNDLLTGVHRIYLDPAGPENGNLGKAPIGSPKRSLGHIHGSTARFGRDKPTIVIAEGVENALSVRTAFPSLTVHAALTAGNLAAYVPPANTCHVVIALDDDAAGRQAAQALNARLTRAGLSVSLLWPQTADHNADLRSLGLPRFRDLLLAQLPT